MIVIKAASAEAGRERVEAWAQALRIEIGELLVERIRENLAFGDGSYPRTKSGDLAASIYHRIENNAVYIGARIDYAAELELGEHPFLAPTLRESEAALRSLIADRLKAL